MFAIKTILLDQIFGFDPDVALTPDQHVSRGFLVQQSEGCLPTADSLRMTRPSSPRSMANTARPSQ